MGPISGLSLRGSYICPAPHWNGMEWNGMDQFGLMILWPGPFHLVDWPGPRAARALHTPECYNQYDNAISSDISTKLNLTIPRLVSVRL